MMLGQVGAMLLGGAVGTALMCGLYLGGYWIHDNWHRLTSWWPRGH
jgi:hypothetical protein